ncbi:hypothetical protein VKT23_011996 [Stygiomarasmius scandens]|uniref:F-box domain-containing protein n=1 Tax=Marasmiellus scandens TaxID=2682957 RepID=A0ABR1JC48_9AGAR
MDTPNFNLTFSPSPTPSPFVSLDAKQTSPRARWKRLVKQVVTSIRVNHPPRIIDILDETRPGRPLPNLPPELWIMIIHYACLPTAPTTTSMTRHGGPSFLDAPSYYVPTSHPHHVAPNPTPEATLPNPLYNSLHRQTPAHKLYLTLMEQKRNFALVSKMWNAYAQPALYEWVWLSNKRQAKALALTLLCQVCAAGSSATLSSTTSSTLNTTNHSGIHIRRLQIETSVLGRCNPADIRTILDYAPRLATFEDYSGMRRNLVEESLERDGGVGGMLRVLLGPGSMSLGGSGTRVKRRSWGGQTQTQAQRQKSVSPEHHSGPLPLKRLTWTCYGDGADLVELERVLLARYSMQFSSFLHGPSYAALEYLELDLASMSPGPGSSSQLQLTLDPPAPMPPAFDNKMFSGKRGGRGRVVLPNLATLVVTLDQPALSRISSWDLPRLSNLSIKSSSWTACSLPSLVGQAIEGVGIGAGVGVGAAAVGGSDFASIVASWGRRKEAWNERRRRRGLRDGGYRGDLLGFGLGSRAFVPSATATASASTTTATSKKEKRTSSLKKAENAARKLDRTGWELFFLAHGEKIEMLELDGGDNNGSGSGSGSAFSMFSPLLSVGEKDDNRQSYSYSPTDPHVEEDDPEAEEAKLDAQDSLLSGGLPELLPNLRVFITNAGCASWDWTNPDWIAPHALLPAHTRVEIVGVRGLEGRMWGDWGEWVGHLRANPPPSPSPDPLDPYSSDDTPFFTLFEQLRSLLQPETFPALKYIRDLSEGSDLMRRGEVGVERGWDAYASCAPGKGKQGDGSRRRSLRRSFSRLTLSGGPSSPLSPSTPQSARPVGTRTRSGSESAGPSSLARGTIMGRARSRSYAMFTTRRNSISSLFSLQSPSEACPSHQDTLEEEPSMELGMRTEIVSPAPPTPTITGFAPMVMTTTTRVEEDASEYPLDTGVEGTSGSTIITVGGAGRQQQGQTFTLLQPPLPRSQSRAQTRSRSNTVSSSRTGVSSVTGSVSVSGSTQTSMTSYSNHFLPPSPNRSSFDGYASAISEPEHPTLPTRTPPPQHARVVKFWQRLLERTKARGVWLEDYRGLNVTGRDLEKWRRGYV